MNYIEKIEAGAVAVRLYQNGDSISDEQLDNAIIFCKSVLAISTHPDFRIGRYYNTTLAWLEEVKKHRKEVDKVVDSLKKPAKIKT